MKFLEQHSVAYRDSSASETDIKIIKQKYESSHKSSIDVSTI